ncbi:TPA: hypothetical protein I7213_20890 [Vibrio vulnificus]|nr:hypothetical protein [Vibrio vulnificus]HDY7580868.1 hypothetical protein [Vibrio vulnificus]
MSMLPTDSDHIHSDFDPTYLGEIMTDSNTGGEICVNSKGDPHQQFWTLS